MRFVRFQPARQRNVTRVFVPDSSGQLHVFNGDGSPLESFNNGQPVQTRLYPNVHLGAAAYSSVDPPREVLRTPAIGDINGDMEPEIVDSAGEHVYAWKADGTPVPGFPVRQLFGKEFDGYQAADEWIVSAGHATVGSTAYHFENLVASDLHLPSLSEELLPSRVQE